MTMTWGEGPLNVWNLLLLVFLIGMMAWGVHADVAGWRARSREFLEEQAALARGDREAARRQLAHGVISLLGGLGGLVLVLLGPRGPAWAGSLPEAPTGEGMRGSVYRPKPSEREENGAWTRC